MNETQAWAVMKRCPRHGVALVCDAESGLWKCPVAGCYYAIPGDPPETI